MLPILPFVLGSIVGITGYKALQEKMKEEDFKNKVEDTALEISNLWKKAISTSEGKFKSITKDMFKKLRLEIKTEIQNFEIDKKELYLRKIKDIKKESGTSLESVGKLFKLYLVVLEEKIENEDKSTTV